MKRGTPDHPKMLALAKELGINQGHACGLVELLLHFTARFAPRGDVGKWSDEAIAKACFWDGDPAQLVRAYLTGGWIDECDEARFVVHDWHEHLDNTTAKYLKRNNLEAAVAVRTKRRRRPDNVRKCPDISRLPSQANTKPIPSQANESPNGDSCPKPDKPASEPPVLEFPCVGDGAKTWPLVASKLAEYRGSFPGVDVEAELRKARQWLLDNPGRRKTARGMAAYLGRWLGRCQDQAGPAGAASAVSSRRAQALDFELDPR